MDLDKIHHVNGQHDLIADDFAQPFVARHLVGSEKIVLYAALRVTGHDAQSSFANAFGSTLYGHPDAIARAADAFESTFVFTNALEDAFNHLGEAYVKAELLKRCAEIRGFSADSSMHLSITLSKCVTDDLNMQAEFGARARDEAKYREFAASRTDELMKIADREARARNQRDLEAA